MDIDFTPPFRRISMCAGLEEALGCTLPADLDSEEARLFLVDLVRSPAQWLTALGLFPLGAGLGSEQARLLLADLVSA